MGISRIISSMDTAHRPMLMVAFLKDIIKTTELMVPACSHIQTATPIKVTGNTMSNTATGSRFGGRRHATREITTRE